MGWSREACGYGGDLLYFSCAPRPLLAIRSASQGDLIFSRWAAGAGFVVHGVVWYGVEEGREGRSR